MLEIIKTEIKKLKRTYIFLIAIIGMSFPAILSMFTHFVISDGEKLKNFNFIDLYNSSIWNSVTIFMPIIFTLMAGYMINFEYKNKTLINILLIPISFRKLLIGKLLTLGLFSLILGIYNFFNIFLVGFISGLDGLSFSFLTSSLIQILGITMSTYIAVLPIIIFTSSNEGAYIGGVIVSFILGYTSIFIKNKLLRSLYPILAGLTIFKFDMNKFVATNERTYFKLSLITLVLCIIISLIMIELIKPKYKDEKERGYS